MKCKKALSMLLSAAMVLNSFPLSVFAQESECTHHIHDVNCGYVEAETEVPCNHVCSEESGCQSETLTCLHEHDEACGFKAAVDGSPCTYECADCAEQEQGAEETSATEESVVMEYTYIPDVDLPDNDELFAMYVDQQFYGNSFAFLGHIAGETLSGANKEIYVALKEEIKKVAGGELESTVLSVSVSSTTNADFNLIFDALLHDCPYDLYWYDKTLSSPISYGSTQVTVCMKVAAAYQPAGYDVNNPSVDTTKTAATKNAVAKAAQIITSNVDKSNYEKLLAYKNAICDAVSYNDAAAEEDYSGGYGDPWQLIYVFDGDSNTNVVCEGYAKAFQYLCDMSTWEGSVQCYTVTGTMMGGSGAGGHMWNIVSVEGENYLVDVTNSDSGTVGQDGKLLFLVGDVIREITVQYNNGTTETLNGYVFGTVKFIYDKDTENLWGYDVLTLATTNYTPAVSYAITVQSSANGSVSASKTAATKGETITLTIKPAQGYVLESVSYNGTPITPVDGVYSFTMPEGNVTVSAVFVPCSHDYHDSVCSICGKVCAHDNYTGGKCSECGKPAVYSVTWNVDGVISATQQTYGEALILPAQPSKTGYLFTGWYTEAKGGEQVTAATIYNTAGVTTYYAQWQECGHSENTSKTYSYVDKNTHSQICSVCGGTILTNHTLTYSANNNVINESCSDCSSVLSSAVISAADTVYNGTAQETASVSYGEGWKGGSLTPSYQNNISAGTATASITIGDASAEVNFTIGKASIDEVAVTVTAPEALAEKQTAVADGEAYTAEISWNTDAAVFVFNTAYTATVTLTADSNHQFANNLEVSGWNVSVAADGSTATLTKTFDATRKAKLTAVQAPADAKLTEYYTSAADAMRELPTAVTYTTETGDVSVEVEWTCSSYNPVTATKNTFTWSVKAGELENYDANGIAVSGSITVTNVDAKPVNNIGIDQTITYEGKTYDVSQLFTKDSNAGEASYAITSGEWVGDLNGSELTIRGAGTIKITMTTAAKGPYAAGSATATLSVYKASGHGTVSIQGWTYGDTAKTPSCQDPSGPVTYLYTGTDYSSSEAPSNAGEYTLTVTFEETNLFEKATATTTFTIAKKAIEVTADAKSKTYGDADPALTYTVENNGLVGDDTLSGELSRESGENAGTYAITVGTLENANYDITFTSADLTIDQKSIEVKADAKSKTYGDADPALTYTVSGLTNDDKLTGSLVRAEGEDVGTYAIEQGSLSAGSNYTIKYTAANLTINAKAITEADVALNGTLTYTGSEQTQNISVTEGVTYDVTGNKATNVGTYTLIVKGTGNYSGTVTLEWSIGKTAAVVADAPAANTLTYDGKAQNLITSGSANGGTMVYSLNQTDWSSVIPQGTNAGEYTVWYKVKGDENHSDSAAASVKAGIAQKELTADITGSVTKVYDGTNSVPSGHSLTIKLDGVAAGDDITASAQFAYDGMNVGTTTINATNITLNGEGIANYKLKNNTASAAVGTISKAASTITAAPTAISDLVFSGEGQNLITAGAANGGTMEYSLDGSNWSTEIPAAKDAGSYTVYYRVTGNQNYSDVEAQSINASIAQKAITISSAAIADVMYDENGSYTLNVTEVVFSGLANGDSLEIGTDYTAEAVLIGSNAVADDVAANVTVTLKNPNYSLSVNTIASFVDIVDHEHIWSFSAESETITAVCSGTIGECPIKTASITLSAPDNLTYDGTAKQAVVTQSPAGTFSDLPVVTYCCTDGCVNVGSHTATLSYGDVTATLNFTINTASLEEAEISVAGGNVYNGSALKPEVTVKLNGKELSESDYDVLYENNVNAGEAVVTISGKGNYEGSASTTFAIEQAAAPAIQWPSASALTYGQTLSDSILSSTDTNGTFAWKDGSIVPTVLNSGYTVVYTPNDTANYDYSTVVLEQVISVTVNPLAATVTTAPAANDLTYNGEAQNLISSGSANGGAMQYSLNQTEWKTEIPQGTDAGDYTVWYKAAGDENHSDSEAISVNVSIAQKELSPSLEGTVSKVYDGTNDVPSSHCLSVKLDGVVNGDEVSAAAQFAYDGVNVGTTTIKATNITLSGADIDNYKLKEDSVSADAGTIIKAASVITTAPPAVSDLKFNGSEQDLVASGAANGGTVQYSLDGSNWSTTIPAAKYAGTYTVRYYVKGDDNHSDSVGDTISVTIAKADAPTVSIPVQQHVRTVEADATVDLASYLPKDCGNAVFSTVTVSGSFFKDGTAINDGVLSFGTTVADAAAQGAITVTVSMDNYEDVIITVNVELTDKVIASIVLPKAVNGTYNQQAHSGYTGAPTAEDYNGTFEITYSGRNGTVYAESTAAPVDAGDYSILFKIPDSDLYYTGSASLDFSIAKAPLTIKADKKSAYVGEEQPELTYSVSGLKGSDTLTTEPSLTTDAVMTKAGTYTITVSGAEAGSNYSITYVNATLKVSEKYVVEDNDYDDDEDEEETIKVPVSGNKVTTKTEATVSGSTATVETPSEQKLDKILANPNDSGSIKIDLGNLDDQVEKVNLPLKLIRKVAKEAAKPNSKLNSLEVELPSGTVILDAETLQTIVEEAEGNTIRLVLDEVGSKRLNAKQKEALDDKTIYGGYEAYLYCVKTKQRISDFEGGEVTLRVPFKVPAGKSAENFSVWYISDSGNMTRLPTWFDGKNICWSVGHFSDFVILYDANSDMKVNPETGAGAVPMDAILLLGAVLILKKRR